MFLERFNITRDIISVGVNAGEIVINNWPVILISLGAVLTLSFILSIFK